jgi:hypothetical protein
MKWEKIEIDAGQTRRVEVSTGGKLKLID